MKKLFISLLVLILIMGCSSNKNNTGNFTTTNFTSDESISSFPKEVAVDHKTQNSYDVPQGEKLVYTSQITLETTDYKKLSNEINELLEKYEGLTQTLSEQNDDRRMFSMVLRIPTQNFDKFIQSIRDGSGSLLRISSNIDNITKSYNDNAMKIQTLETQHSRLLELLKQANGLSDIIEIETRLSEVEYELNQLKSYQNTMDADVAYSTISIVIYEVQTYSQISFAQKIANAFRGSISGFITDAEYLIIDIIYALPKLLLLGIAIIIFKKPITKFYKMLKERKTVAPEA